jgi:hypothetical protein
MGYGFFELSDFGRVFHTRSYFRPSMVSLGARAASPQCAVRGGRASVGASACQRGRVGNPLALLSGWMHQLMGSHGMEGSARYSSMAGYPQLPPALPPSPLVEEGGGG